MEAREREQQHTLDLMILGDGIPYTGQTDIYALAKHAWTLIEVCTWGIEDDHQLANLRDAQNRLDQIITVNAANQTTSTAA